MSKISVYKNTMLTKLLLFSYHSWPVFPVLLVLYSIPLLHKMAWSRAIWNMIWKYKLYFHVTVKTSLLIFWAILCGCCVYSDTVAAHTKSSEAVLAAVFYHLEPHQSIRCLRVMVFIKLPFIWCGNNMKQLWEIEMRRSRNNDYCPFQWTAINFMN